MTLRDTNLVSIIMPSYNCGRYIEDSIKSIISQTYSNWELLIVDDCSQDNTVEIALKYQNADRRISIFQNAGNLGAAVSRNVGLKYAKGRWISFLDSDDLWESTKLEKQVNFMVENGYAFSYTRYLEINELSEPIGVEVSGPSHITKAGMFAFCWPGCLTVMYDKEKIGLVQIEDIKKNNDYAMWLKVIKKADCYLLNECLAKYRRGRRGSISNHSYFALIKWHYSLFHDAEKMNAFFSGVMTIVNLICGVYKKIKYVRKYDI